MGGPVGRDERVLHGVRRFFPVAEGTQRHRPEPVAVAPDYLAEGVGVTGHVAGEEVTVAHHVRAARLRPHMSPCSRRVADRWLH